MSVRPDRRPGQDPPRLDDAELVEALESSRQLGMLGSAPIADAIGHSASFLPPLAEVSGTVVDLGSGGGIPGLVIAWMRSDLRVVLVDRRATRTDHVRRLVRRLAIEQRVLVVAHDARALPDVLDGPVDAVVARGFGPPERVLTAALRILSPGGLLVVSAPPDEVEVKWPSRLIEGHSLTVQPSSRMVVVFRTDDSR